MATQPEIAPPDRVYPQAPPEAPPANPPAESPMEEPPEVQPLLPDEGVPEPGLPEAPAIPD